MVKRLLHEGLTLWVHSTSEFDLFNLPIVIRESTPQRYVSSMVSTQPVNEVSTYTNSYTEVLTYL